MPAFLLAWVAGDKGKLLLIVGAVIVAVLGYFGWQYRQRQIGAEKVRNQIRKDEADAQVRSDKGAADYQRDGAGKRLHDGNY